MKDWYNNPRILLEPPIFNALIRHLITGTTQNFDDNVVDAVSLVSWCPLFLLLITFDSIQVHRYLFKTPQQKWGLDLVAANLWRGRDHGIAGYNFYLEACGLDRAKSFDDLENVLRPEALEKFRLHYKSVDDIDLYAGVLGEWAVRGGIVGPVASCIIADQFTRLKDGDRFHYENAGQAGSFTLGECYFLVPVWRFEVECVFYFFVLNFSNVFSQLNWTRFAR